MPYSKESMNDNYQYGDENKKEDEDEDDDKEEEKDGDEDAIGRPGGRCGDQAELQQGFQGLAEPNPQSYQLPSPQAEVG